MKTNRKAGDFVFGFFVYSNGLAIKKRYAEKFLHFWRIAYNDRKEINLC